MSEFGPIHDVTSKKAKNRLKTALRLLTIILVVGAIFMVGWGVGNGRISGWPLLDSKQQAVTDLPADLDYSSVEEAYDSLRRSYDGQLNYDELLKGLKQGLAGASNDPYTEYLDEKATKEFAEEINGTFEGIGAELSKDPATKSIVIIAPIAGFPAEKAGLRPKDIIVEINNESAFDLSVSEAISRIRGPKGTEVTLKVLRGERETLTIKVVRDKISVPSVESKMIDGLGYVKISRFGDDTTKLSREAAINLKQSGAKGIILDVRNNPGGLLDAAVDVAGLWVKNKTVLQERRGDVVIRDFKTKGEALLAGLPTVVLVNEGSASASEIVAGALKDHGVAKLIGKKTFGKGSVQQLDRLRGGGALKVTIARWYTPAGKNIDKEGIEPESVVERSDEDVVSGRDPQLDVAKTSLQ